MHERASLHVKTSFAVVTLCALVWTALLVTGPVDWDLGWQMYVARRMLAGAKIYIDVGATEQHPPLYTWLCTAMTAVASPLHVDPIRLYIAAICLKCIAYCAWATNIATRTSATPNASMTPATQNPLTRNAAAALFAVFVLASLAMFGFASGSGEQIAVAFLLPYLMAAANDGAVQSRRESIAIGVVAGFGLAMKPHYALVWVCVEAYVAYDKRLLKSFLRPASVTIVSVWIAYVLATLLITPQYFGAAKNAAKYYNAFMPGSMLRMVASPAMFWMVIAGIAILFARRRAVPVRPAIMLLIAAFAMWVGALVQMKGWPHHLLPAAALALAAFAALAASASQSMRKAWIVILLVLSFGTYRLQHDRTLLTHAQVNAPTFLTGIGDVVRRFTPQGPVLMLSYGLSAGFPMINETGAEWTLPESSLWMVSGLYAEEWSHGGPFRYRATPEWLPFEREVHDLIWAGITKRRPKMIIIEAHMQSGFDMRAFAETDPRVRNFLNNWTKVGTVGPYDILLPTQATVAARLMPPAYAATFVASGW